MPCDAVRCQASALLELKETSFGGFRKWLPPPQLAQVGHSTAEHSIACGCLLACPHAMLCHAMPCHAMLC